ncbi:hypothetical protein MMC15_003968 [Xylographa vitiligo]|nr:hypothetical protein [Xylographa vitiligo]
MVGTTIVDGSTIDSVGVGVRRTEPSDFVPNICVGRATNSREIAEYQGTVALNALKDDNNVSVGAKLLVFGATRELGVKTEPIPELGAKGVCPGKGTTMIGDATLLDISCVEASIVAGDVVLGPSPGESAVAVEATVDFVAVSTMNGVIMLVRDNELKPNKVSTNAETVRVEKTEGNSLDSDEFIPDNSIEPNVNTADGDGNSGIMPIALELVLDSGIKPKVLSSGTIIVETVGSVGSTPMVITGAGAGEMAELNRAEVKKSFVGNEAPEDD